MTLQSSYICIRRLRLYAFHGVMEQERRVGGWYVLDLRVKVDVSEAMRSDCVDDTLSYADLLSVVRQEMGVPSALLEHVAARIWQAVFSRFPQAQAIELKLTKENPPMGADCDGAGVEIYLNR